MTIERIPAIATIFVYVLFTFTLYFIFSAHIITNRSKLTDCVYTFDIKKHFIEWADSSRSNGIVLSRSKANILFHDTNGTGHGVKLEDALYIFFYKEDIFSVHAATIKGAKVNFGPNNAELIAQNGTKFNIEVWRIILPKFISFLKLCFSYHGRMAPYQNLYLLAQAQYVP